MDYYPGMMEEQTMYEDMMEHNEMAISQKDWDFILLMVCYREVELKTRLGNPHWPEKYRDEFREELEKLQIVKDKVIDKLN